MKYEKKFFFFVLRDISTLNSTRNITHRKISYKFIVCNELKRYYKNHNKNEFEYYEEVMDAGGTEVVTKKFFFSVEIGSKECVVCGYTLIDNLCR